MYPFGFGLGYGDFLITPGNTVADSTVVSVRVKVKTQAAMPEKRRYRHMYPVLRGSWTSLSSLWWVGQRRRNCSRERNARLVFLLI